MPSIFDYPLDDNLQDADRLHGYSEDTRQSKNFTLLDLATYVGTKIGPGGGLPDAPADGEIYGRQNNDWVVVPSGGGSGSDGLGWTGGSYNDSTGIVTFTSDDGLEFSTTDLRGAQGPQGEAGADGADGLDGADGQGVPIGGTAGQVLEKIDGTDYNTQWVTPAGKGSISVAKAYGTSTSSVANTTVTLSWGTEQISSPDMVISGTDIEIISAGVYEFIVMVQTTNSARSELTCRTRLNTGGGMADVTGEYSSDYVSRDSDQNTGGITHISVLDLSAGNSVQFNVLTDADGSAVLTTDTRLVVKKLS